MVCVSPPAHAATCFCEDAERIARVPYANIVRGSRADACCPTRKQNSRAGRFSV